LLVSEVEWMESTMRRTSGGDGQTYMIAEAGSALDQEQQRAGRTGRVDLVGMSDALPECKGCRITGPTLDRLRRTNLSSRLG
jgi:hypothetical protein